MHIFLGQPLENTAQEKEVILQKSSQSGYQKIQGKTFTYYVKTDTNGNVLEVVAKSQRSLAPASYFIQSADSCTKKLLFRVPLRMAKWEYDCPQGKFKYTTFGLIGNLITKAKMIK
jgi:transposase-like protein